MTVLSLHEVLEPDDPLPYKIRENTLPEGETDWSGSQLVTSAGEFSPLSDLTARMDDAGSWTATWVVSAPMLGGAPPEVHAMSASADGAYTVPEPLNVNATLAWDPDLAVSPTGAIAVWTQQVGGSEQVFTATRGASGSFGTPTPVGAAAESIERPLVAVDAHGTQTIAYGVSGTDEQQLLVHTRSAGGVTADEVVVDADVTVTPTDLAVASDGAVTVAWDTGIAPDDTAWVAHRAAGQHGSFSDPLLVDTAGSGASGNARLGVDDEGTIGVVWTRRDVPAVAGAEVTIRSTVVDVTGPALSGVDIPDSARQGRAIDMAALAHDSLVRTDDDLLGLRRRRARERHHGCPCVRHLRLVPGDRHGAGRRGECEHGRSSSSGHHTDGRHGRSSTVGR